MDTVRRIFVLLKDGEENVLVIGLISDNGLPVAKAFGFVASYRLLTIRPEIAISRFATAGRLREGSVYLAMPVCVMLSGSVPRQIN